MSAAGASRVAVAAELGIADRLADGHAGADQHADGDTQPDAGSDLDSDGHALSDAGADIDPHGDVITVVHDPRMETSPSASKCANDVSEDIDEETRCDREAVEHDNE